MSTWPEARAARLERLRRQRRYFTPDLLGARPCAGGCGLRMPQALLDAGVEAHPTCGPDARAMLLEDDARHAGAVAP